MQTEMREGAFKPFVYALTFEQNYNIRGYLSFTNYKYVNAHGVHPTTTMESRTYCMAGTGIINGKTESTINPKDHATRAEIAVILQRFIEKSK